MQVAHISPDVEALSAEVDLTIDNMLQDIIQDAKTHVHVEVDSLLDSMLDGVASEVEASQCVDVDGVLDDVLGSVVMDVTKLDFTDIDCAVEDLLEVVVHEVKQHNQAAVSLVMDSMITELEDQFKEAVADYAIGLALKNVLDIVEQEADDSDGRQMAAKHCSNINVPVRYNVVQAVTPTL